MIMGVLFFMAAFCYQISPYNPLELNPDRMLEPPSSDHLFGTDTLGRDVLSRTITGCRYSLSVAIIAVVGALLIGASAGLVSGYMGGKLDRIVAMMMDSWFAFPTIVIAMLIVVFLKPTYVNTALAVMLATVPRYFRTIRSLSLTLKTRTFVEAVKSIGARDTYVMWHHILPHTIPTVIVLMTLQIPASILSIASLGFLGIGIPPPIPEWGTDLNVARAFLIAGHWAPSFFPGLFIFLSCLGFNLFGDGISRMIGTTVERV